MIRPAAIVFLGVTSCLDPTQVVLDISTNVDCGSDAPAPDALFETGIVAGPARDLPPDMQAETRSCSLDGEGRGRIGTITLIPQEANQAYVLVVGTVEDVRASDCVAAALDPAAGPAPRCIVARRAVSFASHRSLSLPVFLDRACAGVLCDANSTCVVRDGRPTCASSETSCVGGRCEVRDPDGGGGGAGGAGGSGGAGGGDDEPSFELLPVPAGMTEARATAISSDGAVIVGNGVVGGEIRAVAWRAEHVFVASSRSRMLAACKGGDLAVGASWPGSTPRATAWSWNGTTYAPTWTDAGGLESTAVACSESSSLVTGLLAGQGATWFLGGSSPIDTTGAGVFWDGSGDGAWAVGVLPDGRPGYWPISIAGAIGDPEAFDAASGWAWAINLEGTLAAGTVSEAPVVWALGGGPIHSLSADFEPSAIAGSTSSHLVVGQCDPFVAARACVIADGDGPFDIDGLAGTPWARTSGLDFGGLALVEAADVSADGRVIVGTARDPESGAEVAFRLTLP